MYLASFSDTRILSIRDTATVVLKSDEVRSTDTTIDTAESLRFINTDNGMIDCPEIDKTGNMSELDPNVLLSVDGIEGYQTTRSRTTRTTRCYSTVINNSKSHEIIPLSGNLNLNSLETDSISGAGDYSGKSNTCYGYNTKLETARTTSTSEETEASKSDKLIHDSVTTAGDKFSDSRTCSSFKAYKNSLKKYKNDKNGVNKTKTSKSTGDKSDNKNKNKNKEIEKMKAFWDNFKVKIPPRDPP